MAKNLTPQQVAEKHGRRTKAAIQDMAEGVRNVTEAPAIKAVAKQDKLINNWNESITSGRWAQRMKTVTLDDWKKAMLEKGLNRVSAGIDASQGKMEAFYAELLPYQNDLSRKIANMPDLTLEDSIQRATTFIRGMANFRKGRK